VRGGPRPDRRRRPPALVAAALLPAALLAVVVGPAPTPTGANPPSDTPTTAAAPEGACGDEPATAVVAGGAECLHLDEHGALPTGEQAGDGIGAASDPPSSSGPPCVGDGTSGHRVRAIYARPADRPDRYDEVVAAIRAHAAGVSDVYRESATQAGGEREVRWFTPGCVVDEETGESSGGELQVDHVVLSASGDDSTAAMRSELRALGYSFDLRKYLVWMDSDVLCGAGYIFNDDRPDPAVNNNAQLATVGRVDSGLGVGGVPGGPEAQCWGYAEAHELGHLLGAVQAPYTDLEGVQHAGAPHATPGFHCTDEWDLMCGDDDGGSTPVDVTYVCGDPPSVVGGDQSNDRRLDCGHDDYFAIEPAEGSYLADHWNVADSPYLEGGWAPPEATPLEPPANDAWADATTVTGYRTSTPGTSAGATAEDLEPAHAGAVADGSVWFRWRAPTDGQVQVTTTPTSPVPFSGPLRPTVAVYEGSALGELLPVENISPADAAGHQTTVTWAVTPGAEHWIAVDDWDLRGGAFTLVTGPPPNPFPDVPAADDEAVDWMVAVAITTGYDDGTFRPTSQLNRQQIAAFLYRLAGQPHFAPPAAPAPTTFTDVKRSHAFYREVEWLATQGITTGYPDGTFRSNTLLNRQQIAAFLYRTAGATATAVDEPFTDVSPAHAFRKEITWAWAQGIMDGTTPTTFSSNQVMTRAALADALHRLAGNEAAWVDEPPPTVWFPTPP
jgi:hypothetical protein